MNNQIPQDERFMKKSAVLERQQRETEVRALLRPLVDSGHSTKQQLEREVSFALGLTDDQRREFVSLRLAAAKEIDDSTADERRMMREAAGIRA